MKKQIIILSIATLISGTSVNSGDSYTELIKKIGIPIDNSTLEFAADTLEALQKSTNPNDLKGEEARNVELALELSKKDKEARLQEEHNVNAALTRSHFEIQPVNVETEDSIKTLKDRIVEELQKEYQLIEKVKTPSNSLYANLQLEIVLITADLINQTTSDEESDEESIDALEKRFRSVQEKLRQLNPELLGTIVTDNNNQNDFVLISRPTSPKTSSNVGLQAAILQPENDSNLFMKLRAQEQQENDKNFSTELITSLGQHQQLDPQSSNDIAMLKDTFTQNCTPDEINLINSNSPELCRLFGGNNNKQKTDPELEKILQASIETNQAETMTASQADQIFEEQIKQALVESQKSSNESRNPFTSKNIAEAKKAHDAQQQRWNMIKKGNPEYAKWLETNSNFRLPIQFLYLDPALKTALSKKNIQPRKQTTNDPEFDAAIALSLLDRGPQSTNLKTEEQPIELSTEEIECNRLVTSLRVPSPDWSKEFRAGRKALIQERATLVLAQKNSDTVPF